MSRFYSLHARINLLPGQFQQTKHPAFANEYRSSFYLLLLDSPGHSLLFFIQHLRKMFIGITLPTTIVIDPIIAMPEYLFYLA